MTLPTTIDEARQTPTRVYNELAERVRCGETLSDEENLAYTLLAQAIQEAMKELDKPKKRSR